jgi:hypothetical protein
LRCAWGTEGVAEATDDVAHGAPAFHVAGSEGADFRGALLVVVPELDAAAIEEGHEEAIDGRSPGVASARKVELFKDEGVKQAGEIGAGRHSYAGEGLLDGAGAADAIAALNDQDFLTGAREVGGAGKAVVSGTDDDRVPGFGGEGGDRLGEADFAEQVCSGRTHMRSTLTF